MHLLLISHFKWLTDSKYDIYIYIYIELSKQYSVAILAKIINYNRKSTKNNLSKLLYNCINNIKYKILKICD